jgi:hypothetical protein
MGALSNSRLVAAAGCVILIGTSQASRLGAQPTSQEEVRRLVEAHHREFDYLLGDWEFTGMRQRADRRVKIQGYWSFNRSPDGPIVTDEFRMVDDSGRTVYVSTTVRAYSPVQQRWNLVGIEPGLGVLQLGTAWKEGDDMRIDQKFGNSLWRIRYHAIRADRFSWRADISDDGGTTWKENMMTMEGRRTGPARQPVAWTPTRQ